MRLCAAYECEESVNAPFEFCYRHWRRLKVLKKDGGAFSLRWHNPATYNAEVAACVRALAVDEGLDPEDDPIT